MKLITGLDIGTNSIGWAVIKYDFENKKGNILGMGSRILPITADILSDFNKGLTVSSTANRTNYRGVRRLRERELIRKQRLERVLKEIGWLNESFKVNDKVSYAYFLDGEGKHQFQFMDAYNLMKAEINHLNPSVKAIPYDWTLYYLRIKALKEQLTTDELVWVLMSFNQKRGYFQLRGDELYEEKGTDKYFVSDTVIDIVETGDVTRGQKQLEIHLNDGLVGIYSSAYIPDWNGKNIDFLVTEKVLKDGSKTVSFTTPKEEDWTFRKKRIESELENSHQTVAQRIYQALTREPHVKIRGKEVHTIDRKFYKNEMLSILQKQSEFYKELLDLEVSKKVACLLYKNNIAQQKHVSQMSLIDILVNDIVYFQRPLKSKKSLIEKCKYEKRAFLKDGELVEISLPGAPKSHPIFQQYRIWSLIHNIAIMERKHQLPNGSVELDKDVTNIYIKSHEDRAKLFELFDSNAEVSENQILKLFGLKIDRFKFNYEEGKKLKGNETKSAVSKALVNASIDSNRISELLNDSNKLEKLWHMIYSIAEQKNLEKALNLPWLGLTETEQIALLNCKPFKKEYGSLSVKAMNKLLPVMRSGKYWEAEKVEKFIQSKNIDNIDSSKISAKVSFQLEQLVDITDYQGKSEYLASYIVYGRHSEASEILMYNSPEDIKLLKQHSLRNPIVEQVLNETLLVVRDIWKKYGRPDEIHVESARELKLNNDQRGKATNTRNQNEATNKRARLMLQELMKDNGDINPYSIGHLEQIKLYEEASVKSLGKDDGELFGISKKAEPSASELKRYLLWMEQKYKSPYTGQIIPLSKLFTPAYEVEHVIPRSLFYDDSMNNKIICEAEVNKNKDKELGYNYIANSKGKQIQLSNGRVVNLLDEENYVQLVDELYGGNFAKKKCLMAKEVPDTFIQRQLNDTRYITKKIQDLLDPIVREEGEIAARSKHLVSMVGRVTSDLRDQWGLKSIWKELMTPRFIRMNNIDPSGNWYNKTPDGRVDLNLADVDIKRIDHRHHALDALVAACTTRNHINYLSALNNDNIRYELEPKLIKQSRSRNQEFLLPWEGFPLEAKNLLEKTLASFKYNNRVISKTKNKYTKYINDNGTLVKKDVSQASHPDHWAIRRSIHKETVAGRVTLREYKSVKLISLLETPKLIADKKIKKEIYKRLHIFKNDINKVKNDLKVNPILLEDKPITNTEMIVNNSDFSATRKVLTTGFTLKNIESITDSGLKKVIKTHFENFDNNSEVAFGPEGLEVLNNGREIPIYKVRVAESMGKKFPVGQDGNKSQKFVETDKGTNLFFAIYRNFETGEHFINESSSLEFSEVMYRMKNNYPLAEEKEEHQLIFLSPGDIVYEGDFDENALDLNKVYRVTNFAKHQCFFKPSNSSTPIKDKVEYTNQNKFERSDNGNMIKAVCRKLKMNRLGEITGII
ncbi:MAG TPA: HNH endonuclease domain-containing protein [Saprospiraceae bacterium]|nr:HNH endonuclease domain-containing protein [Saprospiraceae bacterium]